ncbi:hypothetical protein RFI_18850, partial [Reticulomyxa filosa]
VYSIVVVIAVATCSLIIDDTDTLFFVWMLGGAFSGLCYFASSTLFTVYINRFNLFTVSGSKDLAKQCIKLLSNQRGFFALFFLYVSYKRYEALMAHCSREFASENLLFVTGLIYLYYVCVIWNSCFILTFETLIVIFFLKKKQYILIIIIIIIIKNVRRNCAIPTIFGAQQTN